MIKEKLQKTLINNSVINIPGSDNTDARLILKKLADGEPLPIEKALSGDFSVRLTEDDFDEIGTEALYCWISHLDYAEGLYKAGALIVGCGGLPINLERFVDEARQCYAFQQYNAVCALCRTMLEIAIKDIATVYELIPRDEGNLSYMASCGRKPYGPDLNELIDRITEYKGFRPLRKSLHRVRKLGNASVHGRRSVSQNEAARALKETLDGIHHLYEAREADNNAIRD